MDCGNGMNLHLENVNPFCKCRQDGIRVSPDPLDSKPSRSLRAKSARNRSSRPSSRLSPRPPSATLCSHNGTRSFVPQTATKYNLATTTTTNNSKKVLLRYTDAGIDKPATVYNTTNGLPRIVRRYIGRRVGQFHELSVSQNSAFFIDTSQLNGALSIVSHGFYSK